MRVVKVVCVSIGAALWGCFGCAGHATSPSSSSSQTTGDQDSGLVDCLAQISDPRGEKPYFSFASGSFSGGLEGEFCNRGVFAYLDQTSDANSMRSQLELIVQSNDYQPTGAQLHFRKPSNPTGGELLGMITGFSNPSAGTYTSSDTCGSIVLSTLMPRPEPCPTICSSPLVPDASYAAYAPGACIGGGLDTQGSWSVTLTSVDPYAPPDGSFGTDYYIVHGSLKATLLSEDASTTMSTTDLALSF